MREKSSRGDINVYFSEEEVLLKTSLGRLVIVNNLSFYCLIRSYFCTNGARGTCVCVNVVKEEHPFLDRSMTLPFLIGLREVTDKNRLL